jgi:hypothetical protein
MEHTPKADKKGSDGERGDWGHVLYGEGVEIKERN